MSSMGLWVRESRARQGLSEKVEDEATIMRAAGMLAPWLRMTPEEREQERKQREEREARQARERAARAVVYYVLLADGNIKIGTTTTEGMTRAHSQGTLLATEPGTYPLERERQAQFAASLVRGREVFTPTTELMAWIATLQGR